MILLSVDPSDIESSNDLVFTLDFLNRVKVFSLQNHCLRLKVFVPVMWLRNIDPKGGLCNDTKLHMANHVLEDKVITGDKIGHKVLIPKVFIMSCDPKILFRMRSR